MNYRDASYHAESAMVRIFCFGLTVGAIAGTAAFWIYIIVSGR